MNDIILHHYELSPYSEKIRALLGYCDLPWQSVLVSPSPPRPGLSPLTGGYRRIPVMQIGADIYCDTRLIAKKLAEISGHPELYPDDDEVRELTEWADTRLFQIAMTCSIGRQAYTNLKGYFTVREALRMTWDRVLMARGANMPKIGPRRAARELHDFLRDFEKRIAAGYCFGEQPCITDFAIYLSLYFSQVRLGAGHLDEYPAVLGWLERMIAIGHGHRSDITAKQALQIATESQPAAPSAGDCAPFAPGDVLRIAPADYGVDPTIGVLVGADADSWVLQREDSALGRLQVHFPKTGYSVSRQAAS